MLQRFERAQAYLPTKNALVFLKREKIWAKSDGQLTDQPLAFSIPIVHIMVFGMVTSDGDIMPLFIFPHGLRFNREAYIKCLEKIVLPLIKSVGTESNRILCHATQAGEPSVGRQCNTKDELKVKITEVFTNLNKNPIEKACWRYRSHLEAMVQANSNFFE